MVKNLLIAFLIAPLFSVAQFSPEMEHNLMVDHQFQLAKQMKEVQLSYELFKYSDAQKQLKQFSKKSKKSINLIKYRLYSDSSLIKMNTAMMNLFEFYLQASSEDLVKIIDLTSKATDLSKDQLDELKSKIHLLNEREIELDKLVHQAQLAVIEKHGFDLAP